MEKLFKKYLALFLAVLIGVSSYPFTTSSATTTKKRVTATVEVRPGFYWCQHIDGHWSTYSSYEKKTYTAPNDGGQPRVTEVKTYANIEPPNTNWVYEDGEDVEPEDLSKIYGKKPIRPVVPKRDIVGDAADIDGDQVWIQGESGRGYPGTSSYNVCGKNPDYVYYFPIQVTYEGYIDVVEPTVTLRIEPTSKTLTIGGKQHFEVYARWSDQPNNEYLVSDDKLTWSSSNSTKAPVDSGGNVVGKQITGSTPVNITARFNKTGTTVVAKVWVSDTAPTVSYLEVRPSKHTLGIDETRWFRAFAIDSNGGESDVTEDSTWSIKDTTIAVIDGTTKGGAKGKTVGTTTITATYNGKSGKGTIEVVNTPTPEPPEPPEPPVDENEPPTVDLTAPATVKAGEKFCIQSNAADEDGYIVEYRWTIPDLNLNGLYESQIGTMETLCDVYYEEEGEKKVFIDVTDDDGSFAIDETFITVLPPAPTADFKVTGYLKENRKVTIQDTSKAQDFAPIDWTKSYWEITALDPNNQEAIKHVESLTDSQTINALFKKKGQYNIKLHVENTKGYSDETERIITISEDKAPIADFSSPLVIYRNPDNSNKATIKITDMSYSTDDNVAEMYYKLKYDSNNNGDFSDETEILLSGTPGIESTYEAVKVGKIQIEQFVKESYKEPTIESFIVPEDFKTDNTSDKAIQTKIIEVKNLPPNVGLKAQVRKKVDVDIFLGETVHSKLNIEAALNDILLPRLAQQGIEANINLKDGKLEKEEPKGIWTKINDLNNLPSSSQASTLHDGRVMLTGDIVRGNSKVTGVFFYNPINDTWTQGNDFNISLTSHRQSTLHDGRVIVTGGHLQSNQRARDSVFIYDPINNSWSGATPLPSGRHSHSQSVLSDGRVIVIGGDPFKSTSVFIYNPISDTWTVGNNIPYESYKHVQGTLLDGRVIIQGGWDEVRSKYTTNTAFYNPIANSWNIGPISPFVGSGHTASVLQDGRFMVILAPGNIYFYDPKNNSWSKGTSAPLGFAPVSQTTLLDGRVFVVGVSYAINRMVGYIIDFVDPSTIQVEETNNTKFIGILEDKNFTPEDQDELYNQLNQTNSKLIGLGTNLNKGNFENAIIRHSGQGTFIDNSNLNMAAEQLADYIIKEVTMKKADLQLFIGDTAHNNQSILMSKINSIVKPMLEKESISLNPIIKGTEWNKPSTTPIGHIKYFGGGTWFDYPITFNSGAPFKDIYSIPNGYQLIGVDDGNGYVGGVTWYNPTTGYSINSEGYYNPDRTQPLPSGFKAFGVEHGNIYAANFKTGEIIRSNIDHLVSGGGITSPPTTTPNIWRSLTLAVQPIPNGYTTGGDAFNGSRHILFLRKDDDVSQYASVDTGIGGSWFLGTNTSLKTTTIPKGYEHFGMTSYYEYFVKKEQPPVVDLSTNFTSGALFVGVLDDYPINSINQNELLNELSKTNSHLIGLGTSANQSVFENIITSNDNKGVFLNNNDIDYTLQELAYYIIKTLNKDNDIYITLDEMMDYETYYSDYENDPQYKERWRFTHDPTVFENSMGLASFHNQFQEEPIRQFNKVGLYNPYYSARDNPVGEDDRFDNYRLWSNDAGGLNIYVHRKPIADFTFTINSSTGAFTITNTSYDLDKYSINIGKGPGIKNLKWQWKLEDSNEWLNGLPSSPLERKRYQVKVIAEDFQYREETTVKILDATGVNMPPVADFEIPPVVLRDTVVIPFNKSYDPNGDPLTYEWWIKKEGEPDTSYVAFSTLKEPSRVMNQLGKYVWRLRVKDSQGAYSNFATRVIEVIPNNTPPFAEFTIPTTVTFGDTIIPDNLSRDIEQPDPTTLRYEWWVKKAEDDDSKYRLFSTEFEPTIVMGVDFGINSLGDYTFRLRAKDSEGLYSNFAIHGTTVEFTVTLEPKVTHTPKWKERWKEKGFLPDGDTDNFFAGEKFIIELKTTPARTVEGTVDFKGSVGFISLSPSDFTLISQSKTEYVWKAELWRDNFFDIDPGDYTFNFTSRHPDIDTPFLTGKESYTITIVDNAYNAFDLHRNY